MAQNARTSGKLRGKITQTFILEISWRSKDINTLSQVTIASWRPSWDCGVPIPGVFLLHCAVLCLLVLNSPLLCVNQPDWEKHRTVIAVYYIIVTAKIDFSFF